MNCPKCGSEIAAGHQFCMNCGYSLIRETPAERREEPEPAPEAEEPNPVVVEIPAE